MKKVIVTAVALTFIAVLAAYVLFVGTGTSYVIDTSGSMAKHFSTARQSILSDLKGMGRFDVSYVVPFASNEGAYRRVTSRSRFSSVERYMNGLSASGEYTNYEAGIDPAVFRARHSIRRKKLILITDGKSDPGPNHKRITMEQLSNRVPGSFNFYIVDLSNRRYPGLTAKRIGRFTGYTRPGKNFVVIPIQAGRLKELLPVLSCRILYLPWSPYSLYCLAALGAIIIIIVIILLRRRNSRDDLFEGEEVTDDEPQGRNGMVQITVGDLERRFSAPVKLTIGNRRRDDFKVKGARRREIFLKISDGKEIFSHRQGLFRKLTGPIYRSRTFTLKNGVQVMVRLGANNHSLHRYLKEV